MPAMRGAVPRGIAAGVLGILAACRDPAPSVVTISGATMGTRYTIKYLGIQESRPAAARAVELRLERIEQVFSTYRADSVIRALNAHRGEEPFEVGAEFAHVLALALRIAAITDGAFDPTVFPLVRLHGFGPGGERPEPTADEIERARRHVGAGKLAVEGDDRVRKLDPEVEIDLSAIAKGHGSDVVSAELVRLGHRDHMVEIGGEVVCRGRRADGAPWHIGIERPAPDGHDTTVQVAIPLADAALATSGTYRNYHESATGRTHHILDPRTGRNAPSRVVSVSVLAPNCALADGLATALTIVGPDAAEQVFAAWPGTDLRALFLIARDDGSLEERRVAWSW